MAVEFSHGSHDAVLEFLFGCYADVVSEITLRSVQKSHGTRQQELLGQPFDG
jgi:hypothetical protein